MRVIDLNTLSLVGGSGIAESKIGLWWADGQVAGATGTTTYYLQDGSNAFVSSQSGSNVKLFTLSSNWPSTLKYALEITGYCSSASYISQYGLVDATTTGLVSGSSISTSVTMATVLRSSQFTLTPGHQYLVTLNCNNASADVYISDASLIIFP